MKKILSIISAGCLALLALSCAKEEDRAVVDLSNSTPPTFVSAEVDENVLVQYTPAVFNMSFNQKMSVYHTVAIVSVNGEDADVTLTSKNDGSTLTVTGKTVTNVLKTRGFKTDDQVDLEIVVRGSIQDPSRGITNGYLDSNEKFAFTWVMPDDTVVGSPYEDYNEISEWSVIGALSKYDISWNDDLAMISDGTNHVALSVSLAADDEFKFRQDASWTVNLGGDFGGIDTEFAVTQDGPNIKVGAEGVYDLFVSPDAGTATVATASGLKVSSIIGADTPGGPDEPVGVTGWNIIGLNGDWENDILATQDGNVWTAYITAEDATEFKWRKDGGWDENYGGTFVALDEPFEAVAGGDNIQIAAGFWKVVLDTDALTITISNGEVWSLIGDFNSWGDDVDMALTDGKWVSPATKISGGFKIRHNHAWDENFGGTLVAVGEPFTAVAGGDNISVEEGNYVVTYDPEAGTILVDELGWGLVGTINGWGGTPDIILKEDGLFLVARDVALTADDEIKLRYNQDWAENRGGASKVGAVVKAIAGGDNIKPGVAGNYDVYYRPDSEVIIVNEAGADLVYWGVVGTINGWGAPDFIMWDEDGKLVYEGLEIEAADQIKIRQNEDWAVNMGLVKGSAFPGLNEAFEVEQDGDNIVVGGDGTVDVIYDPEAGTITISGSVEGPTYDATEIAVCGSYSGNSWSPDTDPHLTGAAGKYTGFLTMYGGEFKFVYGGNNWIGGTADGLDYTLNIGGGENMTIADGTYFWTVDLNSATASAVAIESVGLIGSFNSWGADEAMTLNETDYTYSASLTLDAGAEFKVRFNGSWDYNLGGDVNALTPGGDNIKVEEAGTYTVVLDLNATYATLTLTK